MSAANSNIRFGVFVPQGWRMDLTRIKDPVEKYETMTKVAQEADNLAYDSIWVYDHFHTVPTPELETVFECWSITAGLARDTKRVNIGQMVTCNGYRSPSYLAKVSSTIDVMSNGRLYFGLGAGWYEHEWRAYGYGFPETRERMGRFREACKIVHDMWTKDYPEFNGKYYHIDKPINEPKGARKPHPMFWIGGGGEKVTLKLVAQWADACNVGGDVDTLRHKFDVLKGHCETVGRDYNEITRSTSVQVHVVGSESAAESETANARGSQSFEEYSKSTIVGTADQIIERLRPLADAGVNYFIVYVPGVAYDTGPMHRFSEEVIPQLEGATVG